VTGRIGKAGRLLAVLAWTVCFGPRAMAYVPPAPFLLERMQPALGRAEAVVVRQRVTVFKSGGQPDGADLIETVRFWRPGRFRSDLAGESVRRTRIVCRTGSLSVLNGAIVPEPESRYDAYKHLFLDDTAASLADRLASLGLDIAVSSPGRLDGRPVYVVGAHYPDLSVPQIWLDKETFRPVRWVIPPGPATREAGLLDVRYSRWRRVQAFWYPDVILFYLDGVPVRRIQVDRVDVEDGFEAQLFDLERLRSSPKATPAAESRRADVVEEVREAIENFRRLYE